MHRVNQALRLIIFAKSCSQAGFSLLSDARLFFGFEVVQDALGGAEEGVSFGIGCILVFGKSESFLRMARSDHKGSDIPERPDSRFWFGHVLYDLLRASEVAEESACDSDRS